MSPRGQSVLEARRCRLCGGRRLGSLADVPPSFHQPSMPNRCRICTTNDREGLIEQLAAEMWESRRNFEIDPPWADCHEHWLQVFRGFARTTIDMLERDHAPHR